MIFRRIFAALALLCALVAPAHAQKSKATLQTEFGVNFPDNVVGFITPSLLRITLTDVVNSYVDWLSCTGTGGVVYWSAGTPTCLTAGSNGQVLTLSSGIPAWVNTAANLTAGTGITLTGTTNVTVALTNQIAAGGPTGSATVTPIITYNAQGQVTAVSSATVTPALGSITGIPANSFVANNTGSPAAGAGLSAGQAGAMLCLPNRQVLTTGTNLTYTTPTCNAVLPTRIEWELQGGGGGGAASGTTPGAATAGGATCVNTSSPACTTPLFSANGGANGLAATGANSSGGTTTSCDLGLTGGSGAGAANAATNSGGGGGASFFGGQGQSQVNTAVTQPGMAAIANTGSGGGGASAGGTAGAGGGGAAGGYCRKIQTSPASSYFYTIGANGVGGTLGTSGAAGGNGGTGLGVVTAYWQ